MPPFDVSAVLAAHDAQVRRSAAAAPGFVVHATDRVLWVTAPEGSDRSFVEWSALTEDTADGEIAAAVAHFGDRAFEWKTYGRDRPADLGARLIAAGFLAEDPEAFVVGILDDVLRATEGHETVDGVEIREALESDRAGMVALSAAVWGQDVTRMMTELFAERRHDPAALHILVAETGGVVVSYGWVALPAGIQFAGLWGGSTLPAWRGRGIYRALVRRRALLAAETGHHYLQVDCSPASRPILERLGLRTVDTTTPYRRPPGG